MLSSFLTSAVEGGEWSASRFGRFIPEETSLGNPAEGWECPRVGLDILRLLEDKSQFVGSTCP
jgi:hypothetical protein